MLLPVLFGVGALSCAVQAHYLNSLNQGEETPLSLQIRKIRLWQIAGVLLLTMALHITHFFAAHVYWFERIVYQASHLGLILLLSKIVVREYKENVHFLTQPERKIA